jgi:hypothetical protein
MPENKPKFELSVLGIRKLGVSELISIINGVTYGECTVARARTALTNIDPNYKITGHLIKEKNTNPPDCFSRAEHEGRVFDNCRYIHVCKDVKLICGNHPI